jgi:DNA-binding transcriptional LysR family regulator
MNLRQVEAFRAVMLTGSGKKAAKLLFVTPPAISRLINDLEHQLKIQLFTRKPNRLEPTAEAEILYQTVSKAFIGLEQIRLSADAIVNKQHGSLRIVAMPVCVDSFLTGAIATFTKQHPKVNIELESAERTQALDLVRSQRVDIGVISLDYGENTGLRTDSLYSHNAVCALPAGHFLCDKAEIFADDLKNQLFVAQFRASPFRERVDSVFAKEGLKRSISIETRTHRTVYELVKKGAGVAILDPSVIDERDSDVIIKPFKPSIMLEYSALQPNSITPSLITQSFVELLQKQLLVN